MNMKIKQSTPNPRLVPDNTISEYYPTDTNNNKIKIKMIEAWVSTGGDVYSPKGIHLPKDVYHSSGFYYRFQFLESFTNQYGEVIPAGKEVIWGFKTEHYSDSKQSKEKLKKQEEYFWDMVEAFLDNEEEVKQKGCCVSEIKAAIRNVLKWRTRSKRTMNKRAAMNTIPKFMINKVRCVRVVADKKDIPTNNPLHVRPVHYFYKSNDLTKSESSKLFEVFKNRKKK